MDTQPVDMIHQSSVSGLPVRTGDLLFTSNGSKTARVGQFWWIIGLLIPGDVDHVAVYTGPDNRCVEAGALGKVVAFKAPTGTWDGDAMYKARGFIDRLYGAGDPLAGRGLPPGEETDVRLAAANFCLEQARRQARYNMNFVECDKPDEFYCSQLAYAAYLPHGVNLNLGRQMVGLPSTRSIVFPQEVWEACAQRSRA